MPPFGLFRKKKEETQSESQAPATEQLPSEEKPTVEEPNVEVKPTIESLAVVEASENSLEQQTQPTKIYLKAMPLRELCDLEAVQNEVKNGNIIILKITPLASKSIDEVKKAVDQLYTFAESTHGDIARLGEERIVICPEQIRIWREKSTEANVSLPTAA